jgi:hypothetical protein
LLHESAGKRARKGTRNGSGKGENAGKWKKDTILTERTYRFIDNKGLNFLKR